MPLDVFKICDFRFENSDQPIDLQATLLPRLLIFVNDRRAVDFSCRLNEALNGTARGVGVLPLDRSQHRIQLVNCLSHVVNVSLLSRVLVTLRLIQQAVLKVLNDFVHPQQVHELRWHSVDVNLVHVRGFPLVTMRFVFGIESLLLRLENVTFRLYFGVNDTIGREACTISLALRTQILVNLRQMLLNFAMEFAFVLPPATVLVNAFPLLSGDAILKE